MWKAQVFVLFIFIASGLSYLMYRSVFLFILIGSLLTVGCLESAPEHESSALDPGKMSCSVDADCALPMSYAVRSDCPYDSKCIEGVCRVVCIFPYGSIEDELEGKVMCLNDVGCNCSSYVQDKMHSCRCLDGLCMLVVE